MGMGGGVGGRTGAGGGLGGGLDPLTRSAQSLCFWLLCCLTSTEAG